MHDKLIVGVEKLIDHAKANYKTFAERSLNNNESMIKEYNDMIHFKEGSKYIKVIKDNSVHSFVVKSPNDAKFKYGDILKAASWRAPARNFARGNVIDETFENVLWTGVA